MKKFKRLLVAMLAVFAAAGIASASASAQTEVALYGDDNNLLNVGDTIKAVTPIGGTLDLGVGQPITPVNACDARLYAELTANPAVPASVTPTGTFAEVFGTNFTACTNFPVNDNIGSTGNWNLDVLDFQQADGGWPLRISGVDVELVGLDTFQGDLADTAAWPFRFYNVGHARAEVCEQGNVAWPGPTDILPDDLPVISINSTGTLFGVNSGLPGIVDGDLCVFVKDSNGDYDTVRNPIRAVDQ